MFDCSTGDPCTDNRSQSDLLVWATRPAATIPNKVPRTVDHDSTVLCSHHFSSTTRRPGFHLPCSSNTHPRFMAGYSFLQRSFLAFSQ